MSKHKTALRLGHAGKRLPEFWNCLYVRGFERGGTNAYDWQTLQSHRQPALLESLDLLHAASEAQVRKRDHPDGAHDLASREASALSNGKILYEKSRILLQLGIGLF